jgi:hypothetical protein
MISWKTLNCCLLILNSTIQFTDNAFGDTYFIGDNAEIKIAQTAVYNGYIYAASNSGIRRAVVTNKILNDCQSMGKPFT